MTQFKFRICVLLLAFSLALTIGSVIILRGPDRQEDPQNNDSQSDVNPQSSATVPYTQPPIQTTEPSTEATTEATTEPTTEATTEATTVPETTVEVDEEIGTIVAKLVSEQVGKPYEYGKAGPDSFDTSALVQYCFKECGISVPRSNSSLAKHGYIVEKEDILPGDAVFFWSTNPGVAEYLGIYIGDGLVVAAFNSSKPVTEFNMNSNYYTEHFVFARRFY